MEKAIGAWLHTHGACPKCHTRLVTRNIHGYLTWACGYSVTSDLMTTPCEGNKYLNYAIGEIPEPQEP